MFAIAAISSRQTIVNKYLQNNKGVNWNGLTVDDFVVVVFVVGFSHGEIAEVEIGGVAINRSFGEFRRANSYCHLYGAQDLGQRQAYF
ncbi:hypothetical protein TNCV_3539911 [Trichonephila clavipes]|nr:hypothetical protein TNCV_3539911 [Trichonephila clavipes]